MKQHGKVGFSVWRIVALTLLVMLALLPLMFPVDWLSRTIGMALVMTTVLSIVPAALLLGAVTGRGNVRAFCAGAFVPLLTLAPLNFYFMQELFNRRSYLNGVRLDSDLLIVVGVVLLQSVAVGLICVGLRRLLVTRSSSQSRDNTP